MITLPRRVDRLANVERLQQLVPGLEVVTGVDGSEAAIPEDWQCSPGAWGNRESHLRLLTSAGDVSSVLVLEDDAHLPADFDTRLELLLAALPADWEAVMLGGEHVRPPSWVAHGVVRCRRTIRTHAYLLRGQAIQVAVGAARRAQRHWDSDLSRELGRRGRTYAPDPFLAWVIDSPSDIPDSTRLTVNRRLF